MPSLPDLDPLGLGRPDLEVSTGPAAPADVLARVKAEGLRRRSRRHARNTVLAVLGLAVVAVPAVSLLPDGDSVEDVTVADAPDRQTPTRTEEREVVSPATTAVTVAPTTVVEADGDADADELSEPPATTVDAPATTIPPTTVAACRNSTDPACGEFRWDPAPAANQPLTAGFVDTPATAVVGETVTFTVVWNDPDADLNFNYFSADGVALAQDCAIERRYGPWTPPEAQPGSGELGYNHTFDAPGTYEVVVSLASGPCDSPYNSQADLRMTITVE